MSTPSAADVLAARPDPSGARSLDELTALLRRLKVWAGDPSYDAIAERVNRAWRAAGRPTSELTRRNTVADCFRTGRRRLNAELVGSVVCALHADPGYVAQWRQALRALTGVTAAATQVLAHPRLPEPPGTFSGRLAELERIRSAAAPSGPSVVVLAGMAGVGKTWLATQAGHLLAGRAGYRRILSVDLRGFHAEPAQPPAEPAAVLAAFLRLLGVPDRLVPHEPAGRSRLYRERLGTVQTLVLLDNAADEGQVLPLLPGTADATVLVTSRRRLPGLSPSLHLTVPVLSTEEAVEYLGALLPGTAPGLHRAALVRISHRCGHLPLALREAAEHIRVTPDWTLADHADRLDERHRSGRVDPTVASALALSYRRLPEVGQRLFRRLALHPGPDFDAYAAAALAGLDVTTTRRHLRQLCDDSVLREPTEDRYAFHDLMRAYAMSLTEDLDPPAARCAARLRLLDFALATAAAVARTLQLGEDYRPPGDDPPGTPVGEVSEPAEARRWLEAERENLSAMAQCGGQKGPGDGGAPARALDRLGVMLRRLGRQEDAAECHRRALGEFRRLADRRGEISALNGLAEAEQAAGRHADALAHHAAAAALAGTIGAREQQAWAHTGLSIAYRAVGDRTRAAAHEERARVLGAGPPSMHG